MRKVIIPHGTVFGRLTVIGEADSIKGNATWLCQCECGNQVTVLAYRLRAGHTQSCGCLHEENLRTSVTTHGMSKTPIYIIWKSMKARCLSPRDKSYKDYGGRGITVCDEWKDSFETFYADMGECPEGHSLDRIDVNGNYEPSNCRWATSIEQNRNRRNSHMITYEGETKTLIEWSESLGIRYHILSSRINRYRWSIERAFTQLVRRSSLRRSPNT